MPTSPTCRDGFINWGEYCNADLDKALASARSKIDPVARLVDYRTAAGLYLADRCHLFLYNYTWLWGLSEKVDGFAAPRTGSFACAM